MTNQEIAATIINQMGGFGRLKAMVGAKDFVAIDSGMQFGFKGSRKANKCRVVLNSNDTYTFELFKFSPRTLNCPLVYEIDGIYFDMLKPIFEEETGLYLSL